MTSSEIVSHWLMKVCTCSCFIPIPSTQFCDRGNGNTKLTSVRDNEHKQREDGGAP